MILDAVCPWCFQAGHIISYQSHGHDPRPAYWRVWVDSLHEAVVLRNGERALGPLECTSVPCVQGRIQNRPVSAEEVVRTTIRANQQEKAP